MYLRPHPEERAPCARLEGWRQAPCVAAILRDGASRLLRMRSEISSQPPRSGLAAASRRMRARSPSWCGTAQGCLLTRRAREPV